MSGAYVGRYPTKLDAQPHRSVTIDTSIGLLLGG